MNEDRAETTAGVDSIADDSLLEPESPASTVPWAGYMAMFFVGLGLIALVWWALTNSQIPNSVFVVVGIALSLIALFMATRTGQWWALTISLSPTILLMSVFPLVINRIGADTSLILTVSVAVPWVAQAVTWPTYAPLQDVKRTDVGAFASAFASLWPTLAMYSLLPVLAVSGALALVSGWGTREIVVCIIGLVSNVLFTQSLVPASDTRRNVFIFAGWVAYAGCLFLFPQYWFITPLAGVVPQLFLIGASLEGFPRPRSLPFVPTMNSIIMGGLMGSLLWADKFALILLHRDATSVVTIYVALLPVVLAQGVYYASQQEMVSQGLGELYERIKRDPASKLADITAELTRRIDRMFGWLALLAILSSLAVLCLSPAIGIEHDVLTLLLFIAPPVLFLLNLHVFQFLQFQTTKAILLVCWVHVIVALGGFALFDAVTAYVILISTDLVLVFIAHGLLRESLGVAPYRMFWRKAYEW
ncbi:hypothetical protein [Corynebacterium testudinoris]|uniref:hypothetical protein n=1 Tax=Corynebacterium testudinoris TaxID=136857 RepID=UPI001C8C196E|nr:hypothetical protein [Corynebacterium testudinoris]